MMVITGYTSITVVFVSSKGEQVITLKLNAILSIKNKKKSTFLVVSGALNQLDLLIVSYIQNILDIVLTVIMALKYLNVNVIQMM